MISSEVPEVTFLAVLERLTYRVSREDPARQRKGNALTDETRARGSSNKAVVWLLVLLLVGVVTANYYLYRLSNTVSNGFDNTTESVVLASRETSQFWAKKDACMSGGGHIVQNTAGNFVCDYPPLASSTGNIFQFGDEGDDFIVD